MKSKKYIVAYDISKDKRRLKVADLLSKVGFRINKSVFVCTASDDQMNDIKKKINNHIEGSDSVFLVPLCKVCYEHGEFLQYKEKTKRSKNTKFI